MAKYKYGMFHKSYFCGGSNIDLRLITCKDNIVILSKLQSYVLHWYHMYLLHPGMDRMEAIIFQHLYWPNIINAVQKGVPNFDTCQLTKQSNKKSGKLPAKLSEEIPWKICIYLIGTYFIRIKVKTEKLNLKSITMIDPVILWFEIVQYDDKISINIANVVETMWWYRYPRPIEITYDQGKESIGHDFRKSLIETE